MTNSNIGSWSGSYSYHKDGNISARYKSGTSESFGYDFDDDGVDESNMLTSVGGNDLVDWDDSGNLVCDGISTFSYNYDNKMLNAYGIDEPNVFVAIGYDCANNRVYRVSRDVDSNYTVRKYLLDYSGGLPKVLVELELDGSGGWDIVAQNYHYGDRLVTSIDSSGNSRFYVHDRNGNVRNVINSSGSVLNSYTYTPYGEDIAAQCVETVDNNWKYTGQYHDKEIGQYYLRARMYSPYLSRFNGYDPVYGGYTEPLTLHQYLYCLNDPVNRVDLSGEFSMGGTMTAIGIGMNFMAAGMDGMSALHHYANGNMAEYNKSMAMLTMDLTLLAMPFSGGASGGFRMAGAVATNINTFAKLGQASAIYGYARAGIGIVHAMAENHHILTDKHKKYTPKFEEILDENGFGDKNLNSPWNIRSIPGHRGRHPHKMWEWMLRKLKPIAENSKNNWDDFLNNFEDDIISEIENNPDMLKKEFWSD